MQRGATNCNALVKRMRLQLRHGGDRLENEEEHVSGGEAGASAKGTGALPDGGGRAAGDLPAGHLPVGDGKRCSDSRESEMPERAVPGAGGCFTG